jgi:Chaperone of endosialidase
MAVPYTFGTATSSIPLSQLDSNFNTVITLGNTAIQLGNTVTTLNNMTLANVTISSGNVTLTNVTVTTANVTTANITTAVIGTETVTTSTITTANVTTANITTDNITNGTVITSLTLSYGTANGVGYLNGSKVLTTGSALTFDGTNLTMGAGSGTAGLKVNGGNSGTAGGSYIAFGGAGSYPLAIGYSSSVLGGAYDASMLLYSGGGSLVLGSAADIIFSNNSRSSEYMRVTSGGNLLVGAPSYALINSNNVLISGANGAVTTQHVSGTATGAVYASFVYNATQIGSITQSGTTAVLYNVMSDQRLKENIVDAPEFGSIIDSLQVRSFDWKTDNTHQRAGFIAQELVTVAPEAVHQPADPEEMMAVDYSKLVPMLVKEIQSLRKRLAEAGIA